MHNDFLCQTCAGLIFPFHNINNTELIQIHNTNSKIELNTFTLNQLFTETNDSNTEQNNSLSTNILNDTYVTSDEARLLLINNADKQNHSFSTICVNARSLMNPHNFTKLEGLVAKLEYAPDVIGITETWENTSNNSSFSKVLSGYNYVSNPRKKFKGGGTAFFIKKNLNFQVLPELTIMEEKIFESIFISISFKDKKVLCGTIYRSPQHCNKSYAKFINILEKTLSVLNKLRSNCYIHGDFNLDLLACNNSHVNQFAELMLEHNFYSLINKPTRLSSTSYTAIDHIWCNIVNMSVKSAIITHEISDHLPIMQISKIGEPLFKTRQNTGWSYSQKNLQSFAASLSTTNWLEIYNVTDPDEGFNIFQEKVTQNAEHCFYHKQRAPNKIKCNWYDKELYVLSRKKDKLYKQFIKKKSPSAKEKYQKIRNFYFHSIYNKKKLYIQTALKKHTKDIKKTWQVLNKLMGRNLYKLQSSSTLHFKDNLLTDNADIANAFNEHFSNVADQLINTLPPINHHFTNYLKASHPSTIYIFPTNPTEIKRLIDNTNPKLSAGFDQIAPILLKYLPDDALHALSYIFNLSLNQGKFISTFKNTKIIPIFKKGDPKNIANYRPISLLSAFSKILEKIMHRRLYSFLQRSHILVTEQFGFRSGHSTSHASTLAVNYVAEAFENKKSSLGIFLDLSKAFDTINHDILLHKLYYYGVRGVAFDWFKSYLSGRTQQVQFNNCLSSTIRSITSSVPQGSVLAPLLFIIYVNDFKSCLKYGTTVSFADDTNIFISDSNIKSLYQKTNAELKNIDNWMIANKLTVNISKTKYILFRPTNKKALCDDKSLRVNYRNTAIEKVSSIRFLGLIINENLNWKEHMNMLTKKIRSSLGCVIRVKPYLTTEAMLTLYHSLILSHLRYCITSWCFGNTQTINQLQRMCNKFIRAIYNVKRRGSIKEVMAKNELLTIKQLYDSEIAILMYRFQKNDLPDAFQDIFQLKTTQMRTRSNSQITPSSFRTKTSQQSIKFIGPKIWNDLPNEIKNSKSLKIFKNKLKSYYITSSLPHQHATSPKTHIYS